MTRHHFYRSIRNDQGALVPGVSVRVLNAGTTTPISQAIYQDSSSSTTYANPWTSSTGIISFYLGTPQIVRIGVTPPQGAETFFEDIEIDAGGGGLPTGGTTGQIPAKNSGADYDASWVDPPALRSVAAVVTASGAAVVNKHNPVNTAGAAVSLSLPTGQLPGSEISVENTGANVLTVTGSIRGVSNSSLTLSLLNETIGFRADSAGSWWPFFGHKTKLALDGLYVANTALRSIDAVIFYNTGTSAYPVRTTVTADTLRRVRWVGPTSPAIGGTGAISGLDVWEKTS